MKILYQIIFKALKSLFKRAFHDISKEERMNIERIFSYV